MWLYVIAGGYDYHCTRAINGRPLHTSRIRKRGSYAGQFPAAIAGFSAAARSPERGIVNPLGVAASKLRTTVNLVRRYAHQCDGLTLERQVLRRCGGHYSARGAAAEIFMDKPEKPPALRVLIVDDEPLIRWSMSETLAQTGHTVTEARDARETLRRLATEPRPDVILLDYRLPDSNDLTLLETIRRVVPTASIVMMTALGTPTLQTGALELGAFRVMTKPLEMSQLSVLVRQAYDSRPH